MASGSRAVARCVAESCDAPNLQDRCAEACEAFGLVCADVQVAPGCLDGACCTCGADTACDVGKCFELTNACERECSGPGVPATVCSECEFCDADAQLCTLPPAQNACIPGGGPLFQGAVAQQLNYLDHFFGRHSIELGTMSNFSFSHPDARGGSNTRGGAVQIIARDCPGFGCALRIEDVELEVNDFTAVIDGADDRTISAVRIFNQQPAGLASTGDASFLLPKNGLSLLMRYHSPERHIIDAKNLMDANGAFNLETGEFMLTSNFESAEATITVVMDGLISNYPPVADAGAPQEVECTSPGGALVTLDGSASTDREPGPGLAHWLWFEDFDRQVADGLELGQGALVTVQLALGPHQVTLLAQDGSGALDLDATSVAVLDTTPPTITAADEVLVDSCDRSGLAVIPSPMVSDVCTPVGAVDLVGSVIESNGSANEPPLQIVNNQIALPVGVHLVRWTATDAANNVSHFDQLVAIDSCWPMFGRDRARTQLSPFEGPEQERLFWAFQTLEHKRQKKHKRGHRDRDDKKPSSITSSPAVGVSGTVYFGSDNNKVYALTADGEEKWVFETKDDVNSSPAIGFDGVVYIGSDDNRLYALDPESGAQQWSVWLGRGRVESSPVIGEDGTIYVGSNNGKLYAVSRSGDILWQFRAGAAVRSSPAVGEDGKIFVGADNGRVFAINPSGDRIWSFKTKSAVRSTPAIGASSIVYVGSNDDRVYALDDETGHKLWSFKTGGDVTASPAIAQNQAIVVGSHDRRVYALHALTGEKLWSFKTHGRVQSSAAIDAQGRIFVGSDDNRVYALTPTGEELWSFRTRDDVRSSPAIGVDGTLLVGSEDGKLYAFGGGAQDMSAAKFQLALASAEQEHLASSGAVGCACRVGPGLTSSRSRDLLLFLGPVLAIAWSLRTRRRRYQRLARAKDGPT